MERNFVIIHGLNAVLFKMGLKIVSFAVQHSQCVLVIYVRKFGIFLVYRGYYIFVILQMVVVFVCQFDSFRVYTVNMF